MQWWQEYKSRRKLSKLFGKDKANDMIRDLEEGRKQLHATVKRIETGKLNTYEQLVTTLGQIKEGVATDEHKGIISLELIDRSNLSNSEKHDLLEWVEKLYDGFDKA